MNEEISLCESSLMSLADLTDALCDVFKDEIQKCKGDCKPVISNLVKKRFQLWIHSF